MSAFLRMQYGEPLVFTADVGAGREKRIVAPVEGVFRAEVLQVLEGEADFVIVRFDVDNRNQFIGAEEVSAHIFTPISFPVRLALSTCDFALAITVRNFTSRKARFRAELFGHYAREPS